jgi:hypothetical protein
MERGHHFNFIAVQAVKKGNVVLLKGSALLCEALSSALIVTPNARAHSGSLYSERMAYIFSIPTADVLDDGCLNLNPGVFRVDSGYLGSIYLSMGPCWQPAGERCASRHTSLYICNQMLL